MRTSVYVAVVLVLLSGLARAQDIDPDVTLTLTDSSGPAGSLREVTVGLDNSGTTFVQGWSYGICHDTARLDVVGAELGTTTLTINDGTLPAFSHVNIWPNDSALAAGETPGANHAVVISYSSSIALPPGTGYELLVVEYALLDVGEGSLQYCDTTPGGAFPVTTVISDVTGQSIYPVEESAVIVVTELPDYLLKLTDATGEPGQAASLQVLLDIAPASESVAAWSYGVCHDETLVDVAAAESGATTQVIVGGSPPEFEMINVIPNGSATPGSTAGVNHDVVISLSGAASLAPIMNAELLTIDYALLGDDGSVAAVQFCETTSDGAGLVSIAIETTSGAILSPTLEAAEIAIDEVEVFFIRSDCSVDGQFDIADIIFGLQYLFADGDDPVCLDACDLNDDEMLDVGDAVAGLTALFSLHGPFPPPPFPSCGPDPIGDGLGCSGYDFCAGGAIDIIIHP